MTDETQNCIQDQVARMKMMNSTTDVQLSGYVTPNRNGDIFGFPKQTGIAFVSNNDHQDPARWLVEIDSQTTDHLSQVIDKVVGWHYDRNLIDGSTDKDQTLKLVQELGELSDSVCKGKDIKDDIGDMLVVMLNIAERNGVSLGDCLNRAWDDIKDRKGKMVDGVFVKEADL